MSFGHEVRIFDGQLAGEDTTVVVDGKVFTVLAYSISRDGPGELATVTLKLLANQIDLTYKGPR